MFKQALLSYIVSQMSSHQEIQELQKTFLGLDKNNDGLSLFFIFIQSIIFIRIFKQG